MANMVGKRQTWTPVGATLIAHSGTGVEKGIFYFDGEFCLVSWERGQGLTGALVDEVSRCFPSDCFFQGKNQFVRKVTTL
eukprot:g10491.t1